MRLLQSSYPQRNLILAFILCALCGCGLHPDGHVPKEGQSIATEEASLRSACKTPGDLNNDQSVNIHDVIKLIDCIVHGECFSTIKGCSNDINADGSIDVTDMIDLIALIQNEDEASAEEPFPEEQWPNGPACEGECEPNGGEGEGEGEEEEEGEGTSLARSEPVPQGIAIRIDDDDYGFGALESVGVELLNGVNLMENISNPVYTGSASCWDLDASITGINFITTGLDIDPQSNGQIKISGGIYGLHVGWRLWADGDHWYCGNHGFSGSAGALTTVLTTYATPTIEDGTLSLSISEPVFDYVWFYFDISHWPDILEFEGTVETKVMNAVEDSLKDIFSNMVPELVSDMIEDFQMPVETFELAGNTYHISAGFSDEGISVDDAGMTLMLDSMVEVDNWTKNEDLGSSIVAETTPSFSDSHDVHIALGDNHLNKGLYNLWGGGAFDLSNFDFGDADGMFNCNVNAEIEALSAPEANAVNAEGAIDFNLDSLELRLKCGSESVAVAELGISTRVNIGTNDGTFNASIETPTVTVDVIIPNGMEGQFVQPIIDYFVQNQIEANLQTMFFSHPLPQIEDFEGFDFAVSTSESHINMGINLPRPPPPPPDPCEEDPNAEGCSCEEQGKIDCGDGQCIPSYYWCDGSDENGSAGWGPDCSNGADEILEVCCAADVSDWTTLYPEGNFWYTPEVCNPPSDDPCINAPEPAWVGDGWCDIDNNYADCFDGGDCCASTCIDGDNLCEEHGGCHGECLDPNGNNNACACQSDEFDCLGDGTECIPDNSWYICDGWSDCSNGYDEEDCGCADNQFECGDGECIYASWECDGWTDCAQGEDEANCPYCGDGNNDSGEQCDDGNNSNSDFCLNNCTSAYCGDGYCNGNESSGEYGCWQDCGCDSWDEFTCNNGQCVDDFWDVCDGVNDCGDNSDEAGCGCADDEFACNDGSCIYDSWECDGDNDCGDWSDENSCTSQECGSGYYTCFDGDCIPDGWECDGWSDCSDGSDEEDC